ncbi:uncharacterized protein LOC113217125 isoform X2 [Frankliniella occidentalis]|uniref:Uncharacterized protein LOC113217125 isoform X2 n=1 Tax=Frankliniella occidentalis TaxID=133901 RepID=A0A9C6XDW9_FRAOC|nr:uncharacterized protein LOC113217125 isoform X2 [Frankliniella occidentalis]
MSAVVKSQPALLHRERYQCYQWQLDITRNPASKALRHGPTRDNYVSNSQSASNWWHCTQEIRYDARPSKSKSSEKPTSGHMSRVDLRMAMEMARHYTHWFAITVLALLWGAGIPGPTLAGHHQGSTKMSSKTRMLMKYYDIKICDNVLHYFRISKVGYRMVGGADVVDADGFMDVEIKSIKMLIIQLHRCLGGIGPNQCEYFTRMGWSTGLCELAVAKNMIWTPFVDKITPTFKCPAAAGFHQLRNATLDLSSFEKEGFHLPWERYIWKVHLRVLNEMDQIALCFNGTFEVRRVLVRKES